jgi:ethanolamine utilization protein EutN
VNLARVVGRVVATVKYRGLEGVRLLLIQPLDENLARKGRPLVAADAMHAGLGDLVTWIGGREATHPLPVQFVPVDAAIVGHVEQVAGPSLTAGA